MFKEKTRIRDKVDVGISQKTPDQLEAIANGDYDELKRRRAQVPSKWYAIAGNPDELPETWWKHLRPGIWLRYVFGEPLPFGGISTLIHRILRVDDTSIACDVGTCISEAGIIDIEDIPNTPPIVQIFTDDEQLAKEIRGLREETKKHSDSASG